MNLQQRINDLMIELRETFQAWLQQRKDQVESSTPLRDIINYELPPCIAITPVLSTKETKDSLIMGDEHLDTIPEKESNEFIKSNAENLVPNPSESEDELTLTEPIDSLSMGDEHLDTIPAMESDVFIKSCAENLVPNPSESEGENECDVLAGFTTFSNVLFDIDSLFDEFADELNLLKSFPPGIDTTDCHHEKEIRLTKRLLYDNSSPQIDLYFNPDDPMPPGIEEDDDDSERNIPILEELLDN
nr:hypothetical protein [Tanacetum cinerariifolium]